MTRSLFASLLLAVALLAPRRAAAASCVFNSISPVAFGTYDVFSATPVDAVGSFTYQCSLLQLLDAITINLSTGNSGNYTARTMLNGSNSLSYNLYMDAARTVIWGDKSNGTSNYTAILAVLPITLSIYGRIPARQNAMAGSYTDTIVVTMLF